MHISIALLHCALLALTSATPRRHNHNHKHHETSHGSVSGKPFPLGNNTYSLLATASNVYISTVSSALAAAVASSAASYQGPIPEDDSVKDKAVVEQGSAGSDACDVVTVTYNPTITVTIVPSAEQVAPTGATSSQAPISAGIAQSEPPQISAGPASSPSFFSPAPLSTKLVSNPTIAFTSQNTNPKPEASIQALSSVQSVSAQPTTATANDGGLSTKRGIIASGKDQQLLVSALTPFKKISWLGDWYSGPPSNLPSSMQFVPQNYGRQSDVDGGWTSNAKKAVAAGDKYFLSFGEPGTPNAQLYMDPQDAVNLFMAKMQPYAEQGVSIGAPGTLQNTQDFAWLSSFLDLCDKAGCKIGFLAMHWFWTAEAATVQSFKDTLKKNIDLAGDKPVWVDNFQAAGNATAQIAFLREVVPWLDQQEKVARYAYVPVDPGNGEGFLNDGDGTLSELGQVYATL